jgi:signal transduction histidine kinase
MFPEYKQKTRPLNTGGLNKNSPVHESLRSAEYHIQEAQFLIEKRSREAIDALLAMAEALMHIPRRLSHGDDIAGETFIASMIGQHIIDITHTILDCHRVCIVAIDPETERLHPVAIVGLSPEEETAWFTKVQKLSLLNILVDHNLVKLLQAKEVLLVDMAHSSQQKLPSSSNAHFMLVAPICVNQQLVGILCADYGREEHTYTEEELSVIKTMTKLVSLVIEREQAEAERSRALFSLQQANEQLSRINKVQSNFVSVVSHEFRTTLTSIQGFSELICDEEFSYEEVKEYATDINSNALLLNEMISEMLDLERLSSGQMQLQQTLINLNTLLSHLINSISALTPHHSFHLQLDETLPSLSADPDRLVQVITNLVGNAIKYSPAGGEIFVRSQVENNLAHVSIQDQGIGIPSYALEQIFTPYYRVEAESSRYITGTGLGLSIVRQIIEMHSGAVWVESTHGQGSTFHFTLPLSQTGSTRPLQQSTT